MLIFSVLLQPQKKDTFFVKFRKIEAKIEA